MDVDAILNKFILLARSAVGSSLSTIGPANDIPAVIKARQLNSNRQGPKPDYPYITVDILDTKTNREHTINEYLNGSNLVVYEQTKYVLLSYRVYGDNALNLADDLKNYFLFNRVRDGIRTDLGAALTEVDDVSNFPIRLADKYIESASFNLTISFVDIISDTDDGENYFDSINLNGELYRHEDDPSPLDIDISAP